jgi:hypothetical protein
MTWSGIPATGPKDCRVGAHPEIVAARAALEGGLRQLRGGDIDGLIGALYHSIHDPMAARGIGG